jgi:hypothetical protein
VRQGWRRGSSGSVVGGRRGGGGELGGVGSTLCSVPWLWLSRLSLLLDSTRVDWTQTVDQDARRSGWLVFPREVARSLRRLSDPASQQRGGVLCTGRAVDGRGRRGRTCKSKSCSREGGRRSSAAQRGQAAAAAAATSDQQLWRGEETEAFWRMQKGTALGSPPHQHSLHQKLQDSASPRPPWSRDTNSRRARPRTTRLLAHSLTRSLILRLPSKRRVACNWRGASQQLHPRRLWLLSACHVRILSDCLMLSERSRQQPRVVLLFRNHGGPAVAEPRPHVPYPHRAVLWYHRAHPHLTMSHDPPSYISISSHPHFP